MKKFLILLLAVVILGGTAFAANYNANDKKVFYDGFIGGMFYSLEQRLLAGGLPQTKVTKYVTAMKGRVDRTQLENATWGCITKYTPEQIAASTQKVTDECFNNWVNDFFTKNDDLLNILK